MALSRLGRITLIGTATVAAGATLSATLFAYTPTVGRQLASVVLALLLGVCLLAWCLAALVLRGRGWALTRVGLLISLLGFAGCWTVPPGGRVLRDAEFRANLPAMNALVATLQAGPHRRLLPPMAPESLPPFLRGRPVPVSTWTDSAGRFGADFHYGGGYPVRHSAFVYYPGSRSELLAAAPFSWHAARRIAPNWYDVHD